MLKLLGTNTFSRVPLEIFVARTRTSRLFVVLLSSLAAFGLMMISVDPEFQYTVDEIMTEPDDLAGSNVFVRGIVSSDSMDIYSKNFLLNGENHQILIDFSNTAIPDGFDEGRTIAVRGVLQIDGTQNFWKIIAYEIQTGCPSKYEA